MGESIAVSQKRQKGKKALHHDVLKDVVGICDMILFCPDNLWRDKNQQ
jgi:hypothetical protein